MKLGLDKYLVWILLYYESPFKPMVTCSCENNKPDGLINVILGDG